MLRVDRPYYWCKECGQRWSEILPHIDPERDMTERLRNQVWDDSFRKSHALIGIETGLDEKTIREIQKDGFEALDKSREIDLPEHIYFDEISLSPKKRYKGIDLTIPIKRRMRAVCGDGGRGRPIEVFERCDDMLVAQFFSQCTPEQLARVKCVSMDLSEFFDAVTRTCLPGVPRVADHYHVKRLINDHFDDDFRLQLGKELVSGALAAAAAQGITDPVELKKIQVAAEIDASWLRDHRFSMLKKPGKRLDQEKLVIEMLGNAHEILKHGLMEKDALIVLWDEAEDSKPKARKYKIKSAEEARLAYVDWVQKLSDITKPYWQKLIGSFETWSTEIFSFFDHPITNSPAETGNSIMRWQNQRGRDYGFPVIRGKALYHDVRGEDVPWEGEDKSDPTAASKARTFKAARSRKEQAGGRRQQRSEVSLGNAAPLPSQPAAPVVQPTADEPSVNSSPACTSSGFAQDDPSDEIGVARAHFGEQPEETPVLEDPKPAQLISTGSELLTDSDGLGNGKNSCLCPNDIDCMFLRSGSPCASCPHVQSQPEAAA
jgi:transposase